MLMIRLQRVGRANDPSFRVVLTDSRNAPRSGGFLEILGSYNARQGEPVLKKDRIEYWLSKGARASDTVHNILVKTGIQKGPKIQVSPMPKPQAVEVKADAKPTTSAEPANPEIAATEDSAAS